MGHKKQGLDWSQGVIYYRRARIYTNGEKKSPYIADLVPDNLTLRKNLNPFFGRKQPGDNRTVFKEVSIVPPQFVRSSPVKRLLNNNKERKEIDKKQFCTLMFVAMKRAILGKWKPGAFHIVQHSSGWDSRLISCVLADLRKRKGNAFIGDILFVEAGGESVPFKKIMQYQGWKPDQYTVYNEGAVPNEYQKRSFDFKTAWKKLNGYCAYPVNLNWDAFEWLEEQGKIPSENIQILTGYGANEIGNWVNAGKGGLGPYADFIYYHNLSHFPLWHGEDAWVHPFYSLDYIESFLRFGRGKDPNYRKMVVAQVDPKGAKIAPARKQAPRKAGYRNISKELQEQCRRDYKQSWIGREVYPQMAPIRDINYHGWWGYWSLASFCDYLLEKGHTINVE